MMFFRYWLVGFGFVVALLAGPLNSAPSLAADPPPNSEPASQESVKIEPYTGEPIYLDEPAVVAAPTLVRREMAPPEKYKDGKVRIEREVAYYSDDHLEAEGIYREYHPNGQLFIEGQYRRGRQHGEWTYWFDNGQVNRKATYNDGKPDGAWEVFRADGTLSAKRSFKDGLRDGAWVTYEATGKQPLTEENYIGGKEDGVWKAWFPNGQQKQQFGYKQGVRDGTRTEWDEKGEKQTEMTFADGKLHGTATRWFADGRTIVQVYKNGRLESESKQ